MLRAFFVIATALMLGACATIADRHAGDPNADTDVDKIISVNQWAHDRGARIMWVNFPQKPKSADANSGG